MSIYSFGRLIRNITKNYWQIIAIKALSEVSFQRLILKTDPEDSVGIFVRNILLHCMQKFVIKALCEVSFRRLLLKTPLEDLQGILDCIVCKNL